MALPLTGEAGSRGAIVAGRVGHLPFADADLDMAETFAGQAALALELADARTDQQRLAVLEDRDRIARDLHDHIIQRLFAAGLSVQAQCGVGAGGTRTRAADPYRRRARHHHPPDPDDDLRPARRENADRPCGEPPSRWSTRSPRCCPSRPDLRFVGALDSIADDQIVADVEAVLRESLTNVAKHAHAHDVRVSLQATGNELNLTVTDDGVGLDRDRLDAAAWPTCGPRRAARRPPRPGQQPRRRASAPMDHSPAGLNRGGPDPRLPPRRPRAGPPRADRPARSGARHRGRRRGRDRRGRAPPHPGRPTGRRRARRHACPTAAASTSAATSAPATPRSAASSSPPTTTTRRCSPRSWPAPPATC